MNIPQDFEATRRRESLRRYQEWLAKEQRPLDYVREKDADTGSPLPAFILLAAFCAAVLAGIALWGAR